jgi:hypothetical protein
MRVTMLVALMVGLLGETTSAVAEWADCCAAGSGPLEAMPRCQWMVPTACCEEPLSVASASSAVPKPSLAPMLPAPLQPFGAAPRAPGHVSTSPPRVPLSTVVLRL